MPNVATFCMDVVDGHGSAAYNAYTARALRGEKVDKMRVWQADVPREKYEYFPGHTLQYLVDRGWLSLPMILDDKVNPRISFAEPADREDGVVCTSACDYCNIFDLTSRPERLASNVVQQVVNVVTVIVARYSDRNFRFFLPSRLLVHDSIESGG